MELGESGSTSTQHRSSAGCRSAAHPRLQARGPGALPFRAAALPASCAPRPQPLSGRPSHLVEAWAERIHQRRHVVRHVDGLVRVPADDALQALLVVGDLGGGELEAVRRGDDNHAVVAVDGALLAQLLHGREAHARVRAGEHTRQVRPRGHVHDLVLGGLLDDAVGPLERVNGTVHGHRVANLDRRGDGLLRLDRREALPAALVGAVKRVGVVRLRDHHARYPVHEAELVGHVEALPEGVDVAEVARGHHAEVGPLPVELLEDLDGRGLLALDAQGVEGVGQVDGHLLDHLLDELHAAVKVCVHLDHGCAVGDRLEQLGGGDLAPGQDDHAGDARGGAVGREGRGGVPRGRAAHRGDLGGARLAHVVHLGHEHRHAKVLEGGGVGEAALLDPEVREAQGVAEALRPEEVGVALEHGHDVVVGDVWEDPLLLGPHARAVRPHCGPRPPVEERAPALRVQRALERRKVVLHVQERVLRAVAAVLDLVERELAAARLAAKAGEVCVQSLGVRRGDVCSL
mmetsp:Transcript_13167/g.44609  ORF Transcript_13167/g.44609 Transcript_13167/m.44609 type:complete len:517 (+) Transcript_13167:425-1975(+)